MMLQTRKARRRLGRGFSLIEVAVAMGLLAIAGLGSIGLMTAMTRANRDARLRGEAATLARHTIEELLSATQVTTTPEMFELALGAVGYNSAINADMVTDHGTPAGTVKRKVRIDLGASTVPVKIRVSWMRGSIENTLKFTFNLEAPEG